MCLALCSMWYVWVDYFTVIFLYFSLEQVWSTLPALELLPLDCWRRRRQQSRGSNSNACEVDQTWSNFSLLQWLFEDYKPNASFFNWSITFYSYISFTGSFLILLNSVSVMVVWGSWVGFLGLGFLVDEACLGFWVGALYINIAE